ncbi:hypothetical protein EJ04DRAFT_553426 [Polyplosphaeria fusca]|uniref:Uncharacterized protein n=1 Tax=Polyplosphaeria fusca TaxID=682080 RepID=A0A9P4V2K1_9PLEO|nr:hypothetical protein EJ04DRAFT_553426 [Polyplosphaeria fusca]
MISQCAVLCFSLTLYLPLAAAALPTHRFQTWACILHQNCSTEYNNYLKRNDTHWYYGWPVYSKISLASQNYAYYGPLLNCILDYTSELTKAEMAAAGILLGLTPTILALAGSNLEETALLACKRPLLVLLKGIGSPAVSVLRTFEYGDVTRKLEGRRVKRGLAVRKEKSSYGPMLRLLIVTVEYAMGAAAIANCVLASYELGIKSIVIWAEDRWYHPLIWSTLGPGAVHLLGVWSLRLEMQVKPGEKKVIVAFELAGMREAWQVEEVSFRE